MESTKLKFILPRLKSEVCIAGDSKVKWLYVRNMKGSYDGVRALSTGNRHRDQEMLNELLSSDEAIESWVERNF